jgi:CheY-like chemotaxis protein
MGLESEVGEGSTFWFEVPVQACAEPARPADCVEADEWVQGRCAQILLADDYAPSREMITLVLTDAGHRVVAVENGRKLVEAFGGESFDLVITDLQMPEMDGYQAAAAIRSSSVCPQVPIIALTGDSEAATRSRCLQAGINEVIVKPVRRDALLPLLHRLLVSGSASLQTNAGAPCAAKASFAPGAGPAWDHQTAVDEFGSAEVVNRLIRQFVSRVEEQITVMRDALAAGEAEVLRRESHAIKGGAGTLVAMPLADAARRLESLSSDTGPDSQELQTALGGLEDELARLKEAVLEHQADTDVRAAIAGEAGENTVC